MKKGSGLTVYAVLYLIFLYAPFAILPVLAIQQSISAISAQKASGDSTDLR